MQENNAQGSRDNFLSPGFNRFGGRGVLVMVCISIAYLLISRVLIGYRPEQLVLVLLANCLYFSTETTRKWVTGFSVFIIFWVLFDYMKAFPNYNWNTVHIESLYNTEKLLFGITENGIRLTPNEYFLNHTSTFPDVASGLFYLTWVPVPLGFATYLFFTRRKEFVYFSLTFLFVNLLGFVVYYAYPAAPPWYVALHGFEFIQGTPGNTAGLIRFDNYFGVSIFQGIYSKSSNVFAAMPSLHSSYPLIVFYYGLRNRLGLVNVLFAFLMFGIWFAAIYSSHHYLMDVLAGISCAIIGIAGFIQLAKHGKTAKLVAGFVDAVK